MDNSKARTRQFAGIAWGLLLLWLGVLLAVPGDQSGLFWLGAGLIFLGLNLARSLSRLPLSPFSLTLGVLSTGLGAIMLLPRIFTFPHVEIGFLPLALILLGLYVLLPGPREPSTQP